ncbi:TPA: hypothetical protein DIU27_03510 [Candidatus Collierbacteria bacterium]|uniref:Uncharacterized protein n=1 Tax=Candidatus Collierbacteria bacterium GW2011_GWB2_44_22 TaxID=1618387 RepID=A0A0G1HYM7_9BACT|nr:MAG: hypothetical protein UW31_C0007G0026 [Candidatus Collierbacteria bacterium GW2011_GWA2_44_13]KKT50287.1 MAG: hypothetical protein UW42_C0021G0006 [Candidatus Collierbacteria bacterium GW2011_GWB1_44_197]KKT52256.1 MAG: hypothetical protein UW44_C0003G0099 [Candidatus Collierbacteria bacterium GW2011_GWB2_44_22]KKT63176.1 MAG: hypothetical protein UW56_C0001G0013 [Candidatus Collierbacteria bacterium GW2011_GWD1_44_27]KKT66085.1 MAG: hypothetical protein UW58_C0013G0013 [Candidatus Colli
MEVIYKKAETNEEIRNWVVLHGGKPATINDPEVVMDKIGLRIDWPGHKDEGMLSSGRAATKDISWDEFFAVIERENLDFEYSEQENIDPTWRYRFVPKYAPASEE